MKKKKIKKEVDPVPEGLKLLEESKTRGKGQRRAIKEAKYAEWKRKRPKFTPLEVHEYKKKQHGS